MRFDHILFPVDFSEHSPALNSEVEWLASHFNSRVTLLHVFEVPATWYGGGDAPLINAEDIRAYADAEKQRLQDYSIQIPEARVQRISAEGGAAWHIAKLVNENDVDLIVMGTHGYGPIRRLLLGSVAMKVLHDVSCPVWTHSALKQAGRTRSFGIKHIVCSIELTDEATRLLLFTKELAEDFGAEVRLVHSVPGLQSRPAKYFDVDLHRFLKESATEEISKLQREAGTDFPLTVTDGEIPRDVAEIAAGTNADLVVIGRGKTQERFGTLRTHAYEIIRQAPCPVLSYSMDRQERESLPTIQKHAEQTVS
jgi:nucleotide-binding universal stress UspA family protein